MKTDSSSDANTDKAEDRGFVSRWSRRKLQNSEPQPELKPQPEISEHNPAQKSFAEPTDDIEIIDTSELETPEQRLEKLNALTDEDMPDVDTLNEDSNYAGFMSSNVSEALRKIALQKLFHGKSYNVRDGLDEYDGDYTSFEKLDPSIITADMKHLIEVEAKRLLAKEDDEKALLLAEANAEKTDIAVSVNDENTEISNEEIEVISSSEQEQTDAFSNNQTSENMNELNEEIVSENININTGENKDSDLA